MACIYIYKGNIFNSELELDNFLLEKLPYESELGDLVFSLTNPLLTVARKIRTIAADSRRLRLLYSEWEKSGKIIYGPDGEESVEEPPFIGVNKFLSGFKTSEGELLFPEFDPKEYWTRRYNDDNIGIKKGFFTPDEAAEAGVEGNEIMIGTKKFIKGTPILSETDLENLRAKVERRWKNLAKKGNAIHNILLIIFSKNTESRTRLYNFELDRTELKAKILKDLKKENLEALGKDSQTIDKILEETINHAIKVKNDLINLFGDNLAFYTEFEISGDTCLTGSDGKTIKLLGIIDLLVVDSKGKAHILDYKTSVHSYSEFGSAKKLTNKYQLAIYQRILLQYGLDMHGGTLLISPILLVGFHRDDDDNKGPNNPDKEYKMEGINSAYSTVQLEVAGDTKMYNKIEDFMPEPKIVLVSGENVNSSVSDWVEKCFPKHSSMNNIDRDYTIKFLKNKKLLKKNENGVFEFKWGKETILATEETDFVDKVLKFLKNRPAMRLKYTDSIKSKLEIAIRNEDVNSVTFPAPKDNRVSKTGEKTWLKSTLSLYCNGLWQVVDNPLLESYGIILLETKKVGDVPKLVDFVRVCTDELAEHYKEYMKDTGTIQNRRSLVAAFGETDSEALSKPDNLMAEATNGNVELMETFAILSLLNGLENCVVGNITMVNPEYGDGLSMSNELALYCFSELTKNAPLEVNNITNGKIKLATRYERYLQILHNIITKGNEVDWEGEYKPFKLFESCIPIWDSAIKAPNEVKINELYRVLRMMLQDDHLLLVTKYDYHRLSEMMLLSLLLYNTVILTIAELKGGFKFRQQLKDHDRFLETVRIHQEGVSGSYLDNPGNLSSETLNLITKLVMEAYLNTRDLITKKQKEISKLINEVKREVNFGKFKENTLGNLAALYSDMYRTTPEGDFLFVNVNNSNLTPAKLKLLKYALRDINRRRLPYTEAQLDEMEKNDDIRYYRVPITRGAGDSVVATEGLMTLFKDKLSNLNPKTAFENAKKKALNVYGMLYETDETVDRRSEELYEMQNSFDIGEDEDQRLLLIKERYKGILHVEHNLETILLKHAFAFSVKENMDKVFPMIKAAMVHLTVEGSMRNAPFTLDESYMLNYIKSKIHHESIIEEGKIKNVATVANMVKLAASKLTLAFAPVQAIYLPLQGLFLGISIIIRKPNGDPAFTFKNYLKALRIVYADVFHFSNKPTLCQLLNELYGINDMDMNTYIDRISSAKKGIWNFENLMFKFASRPDYYNRMPILLMHMIADGSLEAHSVAEDGTLKYDCSKDKRYAAFINNDKSDINEYLMARARYYAAAKQFASERTLVLTKDGKWIEFEVDMQKHPNLPRAYTTKEMESIKSLSDDVYGYYTDEKKALVMSMSLGSLWLQFKTYWSGKKNQYLGKGGVKLSGLWAQKEDVITTIVGGKEVKKKVKYYYQIDENGNVLYNEPPIADDGTSNINRSAPVILWKGKWQEGILITFVDMFHEMIDKRSIVKGFRSKWNNENEDLRTAYRCNIKLTAFDLMMMAIVGGLIGGMLDKWLLDEKRKSIKNRDIVEGAKLAVANVLVNSVTTAAMDFNMIQSIAGPLGQWTPFAFEWAIRTYKNWWKVAIGDTDFWDGVVNTSGALKQVKPVLDAIKPDFWRTKREGGTFNVQS